ncbi:chemotaxis protein CheW [Roseobacter sp.]|uniref:chemotaxis protein CheW n=1 Tax=Roseobacter sp. TaxID=1907202 RepID=UPI00385DB79E
MTENEVSDQSDTIELLSFRVGGEDYAIDIGCTREIRGWTAPSSLPSAPDFILGVINLRGDVVPLLDLAARLGLSADGDNDRNVIIVAKFQETMIGLVVDAVSDIIAPSEREMKSPPDITQDGGVSYVQALTFVDEKIIRILDLASVLPPIHEAA